MTNQIASIKINNKSYNVVASRHAEERMIQRNVDKFVVAGAVLALGPARIAEMQKNRDEAIIIDKNNNTSVVVGFNPHVITIITVINKSNVFVKENTQIYNI